MSAVSGVLAGKAYVQLACDSNPLVAGLRAAEQKLARFGSAVAGIGAKFAAVGAMITGPILAAAHSWAESGSDLLLLSQRTGVSVEALSALKFAAHQAGVSTEDLESGLGKMIKTIQQAADGSQEAQQHLADLGATVADLKDLSVDKQFARLATGVQGVVNPGTQAARTMEVFGKGGRALLPMLIGGAEALDRWAVKAEAVGAIKTTEGAQNARNLFLAFQNVEDAIKSVWNAVGGAVAPFVTMLAEGVLPFIASVRKWVKENKALFTTLLSVGGALALVGSGLLIVGGAFKFLAMVISPIAAIAKLTFSIIGGSISALIGLLPFLISPLGLLTLGLVGIGAAVLFGTKEGKDALGALGTGLSEIKDTAVQSWRGISDSIAAGDWAGAINIAWLGIQAAFQSGIAALRIAWRNFSGFFKDTFTAAVDHIATQLARPTNIVTAAGQTLALGNTPGSSLWHALVHPLSPHLAPGPSLGSQMNAAHDGLLRMQEAFAANHAREVAEYRALKGPDVPLSPELQGRANIVAGFQGGPTAVSTLGQTLAGMQAKEQAQKDKERDEANRADRLWRLRPGGEQEQLDIATRGAKNKAIDAARLNTWEEGTALMDQMRGVGSGIDQAMNKTDSRGTFSAFAISGLGAGSTKSEQLLERVANATEEANRRPLNGGFT